MRVLLLLGSALLATACLNSEEGGSGSPVVNSSVKILNSTQDSDITYVSSSVIQIDSQDTQNASHTVIVMGDANTCQRYQEKRCQGTRHSGDCGGMMGYFLDYKKVQGFTLVTLSESTPIDVSIYHTNGAQKGQCFSYKLAIDNTPVDFSAQHTVGVARNPLLSPKLVLNGPQGSHCEGSGIAEDSAPNQSSIKKIEVGVGTSSSSPNVIPFSEIDKSLTDYEIPMTGHILSDGQRFYTFVRVTDAAGNTNTKMAGSWRYTLHDPKRAGLLVTLDDGRFGVFRILDKSLDIGSAPYRNIELTGEAIETNGRFYFLGRPDFGSDLHLFQYNPLAPVSLINPMNLTMGISPAPVLAEEIVSHKGIIYFLNNNKLAGYNTSLPVSGSNPYPVTAANGVDISSFTLTYQNELYFKGTDTATLTEAVYKFDPNESGTTPEVFTSDFDIQGAISNDGCRIYAKSGPTLEDIIELKIFEDIDLTNADPDLLNPKVIATGTQALKGASFVEDKLYFGLNSTPHKFSPLTQVSSTVDASEFVKCGTRIFGVAEDPAAGKELSVLDPTVPLSGANPQLYSDIMSGVDSGIEKFIGCGVDNEVYMIGRMTGDSMMAPLSILRFNPSAAPGINNPQKIPGLTEDFIKKVTPLPARY